MSRNQRDRGAAAVEFALVLPLLLLLVAGIAEFGRAYHLQTTLSGAAREGVRVMALHNDDDAARATVKASAPSLGLTNSQIRVTPTTCMTSTATPTATATVTVTYPMDFITDLFGADLTLTGKGTMRCHG
ncbi:TadE/TadG family type IV pilus assembly protein [Georgenia sp. AZ-5]|uniref:TadE/TadG family type IV pilus assembly protein n=1 Tax=Georgenia sp. AZ-5 TaxID=3367526 RepID=UPI00375457F1